MRSRPYGELRRRLAVAVLDGVEIKGHCTVKNTQAQQNEGCAAWFFLKCDYEMFKNVSRDEKKKKSENMLSTHSAGRFGKYREI